MANLNAAPPLLAQSGRFKDVLSPEAAGPVGAMDYSSFIVSKKSSSTSASAQQALPASSCQPSAAISAPTAVVPAPPSTHAATSVQPASVSASAASTAPPGSRISTRAPARLPISIWQTARRRGLRSAGA